YNNRLTDEERERLKLASQYYSSLKEHKHDRPTIYYMKTANDQNTCAGTSLDIDFANLIRKVVYWPMDQKKPELDQDFQHCWNMGTYFPTRHLTMDAIPILSAKITLNQSTIDDTFRLYTSHNNHVHSVTNIVLAMHITDDIDDKNNSIDSLKGVTSFIKKLNAAVCQQARNNKSKGLTVYRGATISPIGLCIMKVKKKFFLPTFVSASSSEEACYWDPNIHNVKL